MYYTATSCSMIEYVSPYIRKHLNDDRMVLGRVERQITLQQLFQILRRLNVILQYHLHHRFSKILVRIIRRFHHCYAVGTHHRRSLLLQPRLLLMLLLMARPRIAVPLLGLRGRVGRRRTTIRLLAAAIAAHFHRLLLLPRRRRIDRIARRLLLLARHFLARRWRAARLLARQRFWARRRWRPGAGGSLAAVQLLPARRPRPT
ncbi:hypothetical protein Mapa_016831 [Marchantia paleacea]|nr:hypothetical protein Mapa_016831 [Marchantia paleacea]